MLKLLLIIKLVYSTNIVTWISLINNTYVMGSFDSDDPTLERRCKPSRYIIKDTFGFYYSIESVGYFTVMNESSIKHYKDYNYDCDCEKFKKYVFINYLVYKTFECT